MGQKIPNIMFLAVIPALFMVLASLPAALAQPIPARKLLQVLSPSPNMPPMPANLPPTPLPNMPPMPAGLPPTSSPNMPPMPVGLPPASSMNMPPVPASLPPPMTAGQ
ncbi:hypothetical protein BVRB_8g185000 [Beta vulgaris subsp. vulgaris]|uniref:Uncharacterized protein n=1 Tax=Beta vulgaris subsp. vulgaris TaxID=3555 RepID=A0A0J8BRS1_BETVV|nr:hypothetical protein BVRB_8g185000 [Beta vulgaris subsp. vulgaris]